MDKLGLNQIREEYLKFFESKGHLRLQSFPLVPQGDSSLLIINSGMAPMKPWFSGEASPPRRRVTTCQKCIRTPDIERVGKTSRHGTFFEMLGNFSFGDYFKREACAWAWEFVTRVMKLPTDKLYVTVYLDDDEAYDIWTKEVGVAPSHVSRLGKADNFWEIGAGPCGPCSEIYYDRGEKYSCGKPDCKVGCDCDRYVEFWNLVFTQFNNDGNDNYTPLSQKNIDTGMGLERLACIMQGVNSLFDVDTVMNITKHVSQITGAVYGVNNKTDVSLRVITDHIRSTTMMISDGILPSNEGRGYVLRRLLRRAARHGKLLGISRPFLYEVCETVINESRQAYPELEEKRGYIIRVIKAEEERFNQTIDTGMRLLNGYIDAMKANKETVLSGEDCFKLNDTYGFPIDLTEEILSEQGMQADREGFNVLMSGQKERARAATAALGDFGWANLDLGLPKENSTQFTGYASFAEDDAVIWAIVSENETVSVINEGCEGILVLDKTPFYAEMGGQVADTGYITCGASVFEVTDVRKSRDNKYLHTGKAVKGSFTVESHVRAEINTDRRRAVMRAHSATHLLQAALRKVLGSHVEQAGSLVMPDVLRFDFTHFTAITADEMREIDRLVNEQVLNDLKVNIREMPIEEAKKEGAMALFGEKYGDIVRVVKMGEWSKEFCGGTHLSNTAKIGSYKTTSEFSVAAGVRRIEAVVGLKALEVYNEASQLNAETAEILKTNTAELKNKAAQYMSDMRELKRTAEKLQSKLIRGEAELMLSKAQTVGGIRVVTALTGDVNADWLRTMGDYLRDRDENVAAVLAAVSGDDKITFLASCGKGSVSAGVRAGDLIKAVAKLTNGSGGGKPDSAMGGGKDMSKLDEALASVKDLIASVLRKQ
jgi:alanyl-tRNA synthetase